MGRESFVCDIIQNDTRQISMLSFSIRKIIPLLLLVLAPSVIFPVTVLLREGGKVKGEIITQNQHSILLQTEAGKRKIDKDGVLKVLFQDVDEDQEEKIRKEEEDKISSGKRELEEKESAQKLEEERLKQEQLEKDKEAELAEAKRQEELRKQQASRPYKAAFRSALIPGWGQFYSDRQFQGVVFPTLFAAAAFVAYDKFRVYRTAVTEYGETGNPYSKENILLTAMGQPLASSPTYPNLLEAYYASQTSLIHQKREAADKDFHEYQGVLYVLGGIYLLNVLDAYLFANSVKSVAALSDGRSQGVILSAAPAPAGSTGSLNSNGSYSGLETKYTLGYRFEF